MDDSIQRMHARLSRRASKLSRDDDEEPLRGFIDHGMQTITPDGDVMANQIHARLFKPQGLALAAGQVITHQASGVRYALHQKLEDDQFVTRFSVTLA